MSQPYWVRWFASRWLSGALGLNNEQRGVYIQIINVILDRGECPADMRYLGKVCNCRSHAARRIVDELIALGKVTETDGKLRQNRAESELKVAVNSTERSRLKAQNRLDSKAPPEPPPAQKPEVREEEETKKNYASLRDARQRAVEMWNDLASKRGLATVQVITDTRRDKLNLRLKELGGPDGWGVALGKIDATPGLWGNGKGSWRINFDWMLSPSNLTKLMEGNYDGWTEANQRELAPGETERAIARGLGLLDEPQQ